VWIAERENWTLPEAEHAPEEFEESKGVIKVTCLVKDVSQYKFRL
jgi:hypothetical protein